MSEGSAGQSPLVVFVVEDEILIQELLIEPLEEAGYQVLVASSGGEAMKLLETQEAESIRALVTDVNLGSSSPSGWEVARRAREVHPDIPVVYVTGDSAHDWSSQGVPNSLLITKPFAPAQIITAVSQLINQATSAPPSTA
jgi:CheY-like chemotaxis protein